MAQCMSTPARSIRSVVYPLIGALCAVFVLTALDYLFLSSTLTLPEDGLVESLSALTYLAGSLAAAVAMWGAGHRAARIVGAFTLILASSAFLSEISFGRNLIVFYKEPVIYGKPIDGAHDFFSIAYGLLVAQFSSDMLWGIAAALVGVSIVLLWLMRGLIKDLDAHAVGLRYLVCACALIFAALIIDLDFATGTLVYAVEEMLEFDAALVLTAGAVAQIIQNRLAPLQKREKTSDKTLATGESRREDVHA